jgi:hypothetical protein
MNIKITKCPDCYFYYDNPHEPDCSHPSINKSNIYEGFRLINRNKVPDNCPLKKNNESIILSV